MKFNVIARRIDLLLLRWKLQNGRVQCHHEVLPAALDWIETELVRLEVA